MRDRNLTQRQGMTVEPANSMSSIKQQAYLEAMDITVWSLRERPAPGSGVARNTARLKLGPGNGGVLLICDTDSDSAGRLANDIGRALGSKPVWAWSCDDGATDLSAAVEEKLFTVVAFFGEEVALQFFDGEPPAHLNSAKLVVLPDMRDIRTTAGARRALWASFCQFHMLDKD